MSTEKRRSPIMGTVVFWTVAMSGTVMLWAVHAGHPWLFLVGQFYLVVTMGLLGRPGRGGPP